MTPFKLLASVVSRFSVVYLQNGTMEGLLVEALETYQRLAGPYSKVATTGTDTEVVKPDDYLSVCVCSDVNKRWHHVEETDTALTVTTTPGSKAPFIIYYFINLAELDLETGIIPPECIPLLRRYLYNLINIPNTARAREVMAATGVPIELPGEEELQVKKSDTEQEIEDSQAIIPMVTC